MARPAAGSLARALAGYLAVPGVVVALAMASASGAMAADRIEKGTISGFECGDNCYLTIRTDKGEELTALCVAEACTPWLEEAAMPPEMIGRAVEVAIGVGQQVDGEGTVMGDFPSFTSIVVAGK